MKRPAQEWSRSRYWHAYFLHNRHEPFSLEAESSSRAPVPCRAWLEEVRRFARVDWRPTVRRAEQVWAADPAFVQSLRLLTKERRRQAAMIDQGLAAGPSTADAPAVQAGARSAGVTGRHADRGPIPGQRFGVRFAVCQQLIEAIVLRAQGEQWQDKLVQAGATREARLIQRLIRDFSGQIAFCSEWLTFTYADFNFIRRNLRRARLRLMFRATALAWTRAPAPEGWRPEGRTRFEATLERMVPYRRERLLQRLRLQQEHRFVAFDKLGSL